MFWLLICQHAMLGFFLYPTVCYSHYNPTSASLLTVFNTLPLMSEYSAPDQEFDSPRRKLWMADRCFKVFNLRMFQNKFSKHCSLFEWLWALLLSLYFCSTFFFFMWIISKTFNQQHSLVEPEALLKGWLLDNKKHFKLN